MNNPLVNFFNLSHENQQQVMRIAFPKPCENCEGRGTVIVPEHNCDCEYCVLQHTEYVDTCPICEGSQVI